MILNVFPMKYVLMINVRKGVPMRIIVKWEQNVMEIHALLLVELKIPAYRHITAILTIRLAFLNVN